MSLDISVVNAAVELSVNTGDIGMTVSNQTITLSVSSAAVTIRTYNSSVDGDMSKAIYDPTGVEANAFDRANHSGTQTESTISDLDKFTQAEVAILVNGVSTDLSTHAADEDRHFSTAEMAAFADLTDSGDSTLHYHSADRDRGVQTGTQPSSTISDFDDTVAVNESVIAKSTGMVVLPVITDLTDGSVAVAVGDVHLHSESLGISTIKKYSLSEDTFILVDLATNYIVANYNSGTPEYQSITDVFLINETTVIPVYTIFRNGTSLRILDWDALGSSLVNKIHQRMVKIDRFAKESGLETTEKNTRELAVTAGVVWVGAHSLSMQSVDTAANPTILIHHTAGSWTTTSITQYNNSQYDNGTGLQSLGVGRYAVNWIYREVAELPQLGILLGTGNYKLSDAISATPITPLPFGLSTQGLLVTKVIVQEGEDMAYLIEDWSERNGDTGSVVTEARQINVVDDDDYYEGGNIEDILQEIGETKFWNGFDLQDPDSNGTLSWDSGTRTVSIAALSGETSFWFWCKGKKITHTATQSVVIPDVSGVYYTYFDNSGILQYIIDTNVPDVAFYEYAIVTIVRWNAIQGAGGCGNERHGIRMSGATHLYNHVTYGARYEAPGFDITGLSNGSPTYTQTNSGKFWDEDIRHTMSAQLTHPWMYRLGATGLWTTASADNEVGYKDGTDTYYSWNEWTGATWQLTQGTPTGDYFITFFIATPSIVSASGIAKIIGHNAYSNVANARAAIETELHDLSTEGLPGPEIVFLYAVIVDRTGNLNILADGSTYYDLRGTSSKGAGGTSGTTLVAADIPISDAGSIITAEDVEGALQENRVASNLLTARLADGLLKLEEVSSDPTDPAEGFCVFWLSDGTATGDDGDVLLKITAGGVTKTVTIADFSAL